MITSASGWRKVFAASGDENDTDGEIGQDNRTIAAVAAETFAEYILSKKSAPIIVLGIDTRPTGPALAESMLRVLLAKKIAVVYTGIIAAPEIMSYSRTVDAFVYISASHNPIGHNGIKFGLNDGGVIDSTENAKLVQLFEEKINRPDVTEKARELMAQCSDVDLDWVFAESIASKRDAAITYRNFIKHVISGTDDLPKQNSLFARIRQSLLDKPIGIVCDMNGSARTLSIDSSFLQEMGINFYTIYGAPGDIAHEIIPEPENLIWCATEIERKQASGQKNVILGYMPDCDGDRGNLVYWDQEERKAKVLKAQEVFALSVLSETAFSSYISQMHSSEGQGLIHKAELLRKGTSGSASGEYSNSKLAVAVNCPTSMRIEDIAEPFGVNVFRGEVGEANIVNLARNLRSEGWTVRILGEGSNGGNITNPSAVRDPLSTVFAILKLLVLRDENHDGNVQKGLFHLWCEASGQMDKYREDFTLRDIINSLPPYTTTGVSEKRAVLKINTIDHAKLKANFQKVFESQWELHKAELQQLYGFASYEAVITNGTKETRNVTDFSLSGKGGLKIIFKDNQNKPLSFIWMRGSGTEPVFRVMCDVKGNKPKQERRLLEWETQMLLKADNM